jgi:Dolichyl-phosphate-mannose-protein mannosyltransferase
MNEAKSRAHRTDTERERSSTDVVESQPGAPSAAKGHRANWGLLAGAIALVTIVASRGIHRGEFHYNGDEAQHAVTGLFLADVMRDLPLRHPVQYAYAYYAQYPAVAIVHWPPLFYVVEGLGFITLGPSATTARLVILLFTILLLWNWFRLVEEMQGSFTAAIAAAMLGLLPLVLLFEKTVMLEVPSLALGVAAIRFWIQYMESGERRPLYGFGAWISAALLCKQTNVYILVFCAMVILVTRKWERVWNRAALVTAGVCCLVVGPWYALMFGVQGRAVASDLAAHQTGGIERFTLYLRTLPFTTTIPVLLLAILGIVLSRKWDTKAHTQVMLCWCAAGYLTFAAFGQREPRFAIYWLPPFGYFAAGLLTQYFQVPRLRLLMRAVALILVGVLALRGWRYERPYISGYQSAAERLVQTYKSGIVLFDGEVPGNFVFYMRAVDPERQFLVLRKSLYVNNIRQGADSEELLHTQAEMLNLFREDGIRFVVAMDNVPLRFHSQEVLRDSLASDQFELLGRFPIGSNEPAWQGRGLLVYENMRWAAPTGKFLRVRMLTLNHDIVVPLDHFHFAAKPQAPATAVTP